MRSDEASSLTADRLARIVATVGTDKVDLYGESYGRRYVQTYAAIHPDRIKALFIDGPVDLAPSAIAYYTEGARAFDDDLVSTLAECRKSAACLEAIGGAHVIFGRGDTCPDKPITDYLVSGTLPATRVTVCPNVVSDEYVPNARPRAADYRDALALMSDMETQVTTGWSNGMAYRSPRPAPAALLRPTETGSTARRRPGIAAAFDGWEAAV